MKPWPQILGETTTRSMPSGGGLTPPALPLILPKDSPSACISTVQGVLTHSRPIIAFSDAFASSCVIPLATTVTPEGCPPTDIAVGKFAIKRGGIGLALQLPFPKISESMGNHDSKIVDAGSVD